jgi:hypothetical protein
MSETITARKAILKDKDGNYIIPVTPDIVNEGLEYLVGVRSNIQDQIDMKQDKDDIVYDLLIDDANESNPANAVSYAGINTAYTPSYMDFSGGSFNYGSWADSFFLKLFKPCMLKYDGTVDYFLDPTNYAYKDDKITPSDISDTTYGGNAMVQIGQIWISEANTTDGKKHIRIANRKLDDSFECYTHKKKDGTYADYIYRSLFDGALVDSKIRSIKGLDICTNQTGSNQITYAKNNGTGWNIDEYALRRTINYLLILMGKSLNTQAVFGQGATSGYVSATNTGQKQTGTLSDKGMFWGSNGTTSAVKTFHMENLWGNAWKLTNGLILTGGKLKYKMCEGTGDGSTTENYNTDGTGYINSDITPGGTSGGFISESTLIPGLGLVPKTMSGSDSTYYCDAMWFNTSQTGFARFGGGTNGGSRCGAFYCSLDGPVSVSGWLCGVALSYKKQSS